jgi:hypothetical protein
MGFDLIGMFMLIKQKEKEVKKISTLVVSVFVGVLAGCVAHPAGFDYTDKTQTQKALSDPYTALGTGDEESAFGDAAISDVESSEETVSDAYAPADPAAADEPSAPGCNVYSLLIRWGQLTGVNHDVSNMTTWTGSISANVGTLAVIKKVAFDREDSVSARTDPKVIDFISRTRPYFDGLRIRYEVCDADIALLGDGESATLTFNAPGVPFTKSYTVAELVDLNDLIENVDASKDRFQALAVKKTDRCQGTLQGDWIKLGDDYGVFKGIVVASNGIQVGYVKGIFGQTSDGKSKWAAKFISHEGRFGGILRGEYADSAFTGDIFNRNKTDIGNIDGSYVEAEVGTPGTFSANYKLDCADVPASNE